LRASLKYSYFCATMVFVNASIGMARNQHPRRNVQTRRVRRQNRRQRQAFRTCSAELGETRLLAESWDGSDDCIVTALGLVREAGPKVAVVGMVEELPDCSASLATWAAQKECELQDDLLVTGSPEESCWLPSQSRHHLSMHKAIDAMQSAKVERCGTTTMLGSHITQIDDQTSTGKRTRFNLDAIVVCNVTPYSEIYGLHPREFVFDKHFHMLPFDYPCMSGEDSNDSDEEEDADV